MASYSGSYQPAPEADVDPSAADAVEARQRLGEHGCRAQRLADHECAQARPGHRPRQRGQRDQRLERALAGVGSAVLPDVEEEVVGEPQRVEAEGFRAVRVVEQRRPRQRRLARHGVVVLRQRQPDSHDRSLARCSNASPTCRKGDGSRSSTSSPAACRPSLLDLHSDPDHHRSVFTLAGPGVRRRRGRNPPVGAGRGRASRRVEARGRPSAVRCHRRRAVRGPRRIETRRRRGRRSCVRRLDLCRARRACAAVRTTPIRSADRFPRSARVARAEPAPDRLGAVAVGARPVLVAVNCNLDTRDLVLARRIATSVRERDGGLPGVRALGFGLASRACVQVSMNLTDLAATGIEPACTLVRDRSRRAGHNVSVELVGLLPRAELERCSDEFLVVVGARRRSHDRVPHSSVSGRGR